MKQPSDADRQAPTGPVPTMFEAIVRQMTVTATYNRGAVTLAPHIIYTRHGEIHIDATTVERDGKPPREAKLGTFKLAGLGETTTTARGFDRFAGYDANDPKYTGVTIFAIEG